MNDEGCFIVMFAVCLTIGIPGAVGYILRSIGFSEIIATSVMGALFVATLGGWLLLGHAFAWYKRKRIDDPVFGHLESYGNAVWYGSWNGENRISVKVFADETGPTERQRQTFLELKARLKSLDGAIEVPLHKAYVQRRSAAKDEYHQHPELIDKLDADFPDIREPREIWSIADLVSIDIQVDGLIDVALSYAIDWGDPEHNLSVQIKDWQVLDVGKEG